MPITTHNYVDGIFRCTFTGDVDEQDATAWAQLMHRYSEQTSLPLVSVMDMLEARSLKAAGRQFFARATNHPQVHQVAIAADDFQMRQHVRLLMLMSVNKNIDTFNSLDAALTFAQNRAQLLKDLQSGT